MTGDDGSYSYSGIPAGSYRVKFQISDVNNSAPAVFYHNKLSFADSDTLTFGDATVTQGVDAIIGAWGEIAGQATNASGTGIAGIQVVVCNAAGQPIAALPAVTTKSDGSYVVGGVDPAKGPYKVRFNGNSLYQGQWYSGAAQQSAATPVPVVGYQTTSVSQVLPTASVSGIVTNALGAPIPNIQVYLYDAALNFFPVGGVFTQADGSYAFSGVAAGTYGVLFQDISAPPVYSKQYYSLKTTRPAPSVTVSAGTPKTGINATLGTGIPIITGFSVPLTSNSSTVTNIVLTAVEPSGVSGYLLTESALPPTAATPGWSVTAPTSYTFASGGVKTLYAWAKGVAGVSASATQSVTVTLNLTLQVQLSGSGSVNSVPGGIACATGTAPSGCSANFNGSATLTASASGGYLFVGWTGVCAGSGAICNASFGTNTTVTAFFEQAPVAMIGTTGYSSLQEAYDDATTGALIELEEGVLAGSLRAARDVTVTVAGGYLSDYSSQPGETTLDGQVFLNRGEVKFFRFNLK